MKDAPVRPLLTPKQFLYHLLWLMDEYEKEKIKQTRRAADRADKRFIKNLNKGVKK